MLAGSLAAGVTALTGCGVRLEDDAPRIPFVPTRDPIPGESALLAVLGALDASDEEHAGERADLLRTALLDAQVPESLVTEAAAPVSGGETVAAFEGAVRDCGPGILPLVGRLTATHRITAPDTQDLWSAPTTQPWTAGAVAARAREATRATIYALDLIAARAGSERIQKHVLAAGRGLRELSVRQTSAAGEEVTPAPLGYEIPHELTPQEAQELGTRSFRRLLAVYADGFARLGDDRAAALEVTRWMVTVERLSRDRFPIEVPVLYGDDPTDS